MSEAKRLHPVSILFDLIFSVRQFILPIIIGFFSFRNDSLVYYLLALAGLLLLYFVIAIIVWYRFTYRVVDDELRIEHGVFVRKKRHISKNRIQSIDLTSGIIHRIFHLTKVEIETAGTGMEAEASLSAVKRAEGEALRRELKSGDTGAAVNDELDNETSEQPERPHSAISPKRLFIAATTSGSVGVIIVFALTGFSQFEQFIPEETFKSTFNWAIGLGLVIIITLAVLFLLLLWLLGIAGTIIKYGKFTITRNEQELFITRGLLEKKQITIPLRRIQAIGIQETIIRQPLGYVTVFAEIAGGSMDRGEDFSSILFPIMKEEEVNDFLAVFLPEYAGVDYDLRPLPKRARKFYMLRASWPFLLLIAAVGWLFLKFIWIPVVLLVIGGIGLGWLRHRDGGFKVTGKRVTIRYRGLLSRNTVLMYHKRIQAYEKKQHKLQKWQNLATANFSIIGTMGAGTHFTVKDLAVSDTHVLSDWYSRQRTRTDN
ncbi:PH domain-containing protein [Barrientosiimonas marina]|uniref:PH domain-containing protein n=1 Tax=Lentibacillus kimchii TaxID=1542911 RepID=A0ABW2USK0_9BACI